MLPTCLEAGMNRLYWTFAITSLALFAFTLDRLVVAIAQSAIRADLGAQVAPRAVQGAGGALMVPLTLTMLSAVTPPERRGAVLGAWGGIGGLGAALGPLAGGGFDRRRRRGGR